MRYEAISIRSLSSTFTIRMAEDTVDGGAPVSTDAMGGEFFSFPYEPYSIQLDLMRQIWTTLEQGHCGIFESPTGTGKSISLICGALTWLTKHTDEYGLQQSVAKAKVTATERDTRKKSAEPSWLDDFEQKSADLELKYRQQMAKEALTGIEKLRLEPETTTKKRKMRIAYNHNERKRVHQSGSSKANKQDGDEDEHLVDPYDSDRVERRNSGSGDESEPASSGRFGEGKPKFGVVKIIYCSRTHSQISQFVREIRKTAFGKHIRVVSLGSRKNLCTNPKVTKLSSDLRMTDKCLDMMQSSKTKDGKKVAKCPFYEKELLGHYKNYALAHVQDIEDLHTLGEEMSICSYYGTRESIPLAQIVTVPYSMLLSKDTRETLGIALKDNIVIFDEAHNIIDAINNTYKVEITSKRLVVARRTLWSYFSKYEKRFKGKNAFYIKQLLSILESLTKFLRQLSKSAGKATLTGEDDDGTTGAQMMTINDFLFSARIDHFNMFKILEYLGEIRRWLATNLYEQIQAKKAIFSEPKKSDELAEVLMQYSAACSRGNRSGNGAMLLSVVGGKMSEGINFSDELARCVVMVGMPYPNARDAELVAKMAFLDKRNPGSGRQFYKSLCMKALNQSIAQQFAVACLSGFRSASNLRRHLDRYTPSSFSSFRAKERQSASGQ
ncbi:Drug/Metabolite Transporter (DMT) Superfamily [Phytophthora nicotianae]|uniref:Drug/Metabolite Transporter (DMT) Superfamily n=1 Tax=Phytophthora nicotianae TaxID=4792 RepID=A0A0W8DLA1_PHYNI|nr:Drug/Metabolite Transporter (DMT) Superfamily [Phytophthora nicotianae]